MPTATSAASQALPRGLRIRRRRRPVWLAAAAVIGGGIVFGSVLTGASPGAILGTLAILLAIGAAVYRLALALAVLAFTYPFDLTTIVGPLKLTTSAVLMGIVVATWGVRFLASDRAIWIKSPLDRAVLFFAGATALSLLGFGGYLQDQLVALVKAGGGFLIFFIATQSLEERRDVWTVVGAVIAAGLPQAVVLALQVLSGAQVISEQSRATGMVIDANLFAGYLVLVIPLSIVAGLALRTRLATLVTGVAVLALSIAMIATLSRSGWLGMLTSIVVLIALLRKQRRQLVAVVGAITALLVVGGVGGPIADRLGPHADGPLEMLASRWNVWVEAVVIFLHHPVFGVGVANFRNYLDYVPDDPGLNHAHNLFLNTAAERGSIGLVALLYVLVVLGQTLYRTLPNVRGSVDRLLITGLLASFIGYLAHSLLEVSYYDYKILLLFWLLVGLAGTIPRLFPPQRKEHLWPRHVSSPLLQPRAQDPRANIGAFPRAAESAD